MLRGYVAGRSGWLPKIRSSSATVVGWVGGVNGGHFNSLSGSALSAAAM